MKIAIMQPYFFPYIGYFQLINAVDEFIMFDTPQHIRHGWIERNRVLKQNGESLYINVPLEKHKRETIIKELRIKNSEKWKKKIFAQLVPYKKKAPYYFEIIQLLEEVLKKETDSIVELNFLLLKSICDYLDIDTPIKIWSKMNIEIEDVKSPDEWALNICKALDAKTYYNPEGGISFFVTNKYTKENIDIKFLKSIAIPYKQFDNDFVPFLSIIDVMMFCDKTEIINMLGSYKFI